MFLYLSEQYFKSTGAQLAAPQETPATGCLHPSHSGYFNSPAEYMK
jgi:magnesium chelatase subunit H